MPWTHLRRRLTAAATALLGTASPTAAQFAVRGPLDSNVVGYYFDHQPGPGALDWKCQSGGPLDSGQPGRAYDGHRGSDFWAYRNAPVYAAACGRVTFVQDGFPDGYLGSTDGGGFGNQVWIDHGNGAVTIYGHLQAWSIVVTAGQLVSAGTRLGGMGTSGNSSGLHLHFEIHQNGRAVDPFYTPGGCNTTVSASLWTDQNWDRPGTLAPLCAQEPPTDPTAQAQSQPPSPMAGEIVLLVVSVVPGLNPPSSGLEVTADARAIGGPSALQLLDTGIAGGCDDIAGDNVFVACATVDLYTGPGSKTLRVAIGDAQGRSAAATIAIDVRRPADTDEDGLPDVWESQWGLNPSSSSGADGAAGDLDGDGASNLAEYQNRSHPRGVFTRYLAEGATSALFDTRLAVLNPAPTAALVNVRFLRSGAAPAAKPVSVPARTRRTLTAKTYPELVQAEFSTVVESDVPVIVDRTMAWDARGYGAHAETAVNAPAATWYLAEGSTVGGFNLFYLLQNPNATESLVRARYLRPSGAPLEKTYTLVANSRTNIWVDLEEFPGLGQALANTDVSAVFEVLNGPPIIVERAMYADVPGQTFGAGHESAGITTTALEWFLAEGATGPYFDLFVLIANPGSRDANVEATYLLPDGTTVVKPYTVAANSRFNIWVDYEGGPLADTAVSTTVRSTNGVPIIVERAMWWPDGAWHEAHNSPGATTTGTRWALAEGEVDASRHLETYILVANTAATPADVKVTLLFEDGASAEQTYAGIPAKSRFNVPVGEFFPQAAKKRFGAIVESLGNIPAEIVVERAMYWDAAGQRWAAGTNALATKLQ